MYLRFVVADTDADSQRSSGIFHAINHLENKDKLNEHEKELYHSVYAWFRENLKKPTRFTASKPPYSRKKNRALSWFKDTTQEHLIRIRELVAIVENHDISVRMIKTDRVGYIVYEDEFQIVAEPFADTPC